MKTSRRGRGWKDGKEHTFCTANVSFCHIMMIAFVILTRFTAPSSKDENLMGGRVEDMEGAGVGRRTVRGECQVICALAASTGEMDVARREQRGRKQAVGAVRLKRIKVAAGRK